ncbi:MAG: hypothetical protein HZC49_11935 [Nitrospirae bacterium]|nr:hypothetical protein [Nitrospirota bacterium]
MNIFAFAGAVLGTTCLSLALLVAMNRKTTLHRIWALFNLSVAIWGIGAFFIGISTTPSSAIVSWKLAHVGGIFIPVCFFHTICVFCEIDTKRKRAIQFAYLQGFFFLFMNFTDFFITKVRFAFNSLYYNQAAGACYPVFFMIWVGLVIWGHYELITYYKKSSGIKRHQSIYFFIGMLLGFAGGSTNFFPMFGIDIYPFGNFTIPIYCLISTYAILRYRLMDINLVFRKSMVYSLSAGIITSLFVVIVLTMTKFVSNVAGSSSFAITTLAALTIAVLFNPLKNKIQSFIDKSFYKGRYDYYPTIRKISRELVTIFDLDDLFKYVGKTILQTLGLNSIYLLRAVPGSGYEIVYHQSHNNDHDNTGKENVGEEDEGMNIKMTSELIEFYKKSEDVLVKDELPGLEKNLGRGIIERIKQDLLPFNGEVVVPVFNDKKLTLLLVLGEKVSGDMYTNEDINLLGIVSTQLAVSIRNAMLYKDKMHSERLASIGMMSATFAHEVRNPLTSLKTFAQLMPEKYNDEEFRVSFSKIVEGEIERIDGLINDLLDFSTERKSSRSNNFNLVSLVDETVEYVKGKLDFERKNITIEKNYGASVIEMSGDATNLKQAFVNLITNGCQAMYGEGLLKVQINPNGENVDVAITDTGEGIHPDDIAKIFDPFVTTKEMGIGLGLAISKRIVEDHKGSIKVKSRLSQGTTFTISLPVQN